MNIHEGNYLHAYARLSLNWTTSNLVATAMAIRPTFSSKFMYQVTEDTVFGQSQGEPLVELNLVLFLWELNNLIVLVK